MYLCGHRHQAGLAPFPFHLHIRIEIIVIVGNVLA